MNRTGQVVFVLLFALIFEVCAQSQFESYEHAKDMQDSLPDITVRWRDCRQIYRNIQTLRHSETSFKQGLAELRQCFADSSADRQKYTEVAALINFLNDKGPEELQIEGWSKDQANEVPQWWKKVCNFYEKLRVQEKTGPNYNQISTFLEKFG